LLSKTRAVSNNEIASSSTAAAEGRSVVAISRRGIARDGARHLTRPSATGVARSRPRPAEVARQEDVEPRQGR
jgi:hypothetical protein